jgi:hypothetical protein
MSESLTVNAASASAIVARDGIENHCSAMLEERRETKPAAEIAIAESALRQRLEAIARQEMLRRRARLGLITQEQERALEHLLVSTVERISSPIVERARLCYTSGEIEKAHRWCSIFG